MRSRFPNLRFSTLLKLMAVVLNVKVTVDVLWEYRRYLPPDFDADFLLGRESYFWGAYSGAFYVHLFSGPFTLLLGAILTSDWFRQKYPGWHRRLGKWQVGCVLFLLVPSGLWMSYYALSGRVAALGLGTLAILTAVCVSMGWQAVRKRRFDVHRRWMQRTFLLLFSAVVIRLIGGIATVIQYDEIWLYSASTWLSWLVPLLVFEVVEQGKQATSGNVLHSG